MKAQSLPLVSPTCECGLLLPMPLHSARPSESTPRASRHKPPCLSTLNTASCSGTLRETSTERKASGHRSDYHNKAQLDYTDPRTIELLNQTTSHVHKQNRLLFKWRVSEGHSCWETQIQPGMRGLVGQMQQFSTEMRLIWTICFNSGVGGGSEQNLIGMEKEGFLT